MEVRPHVQTARMRPGCGLEPSEGAQMYRTIVTAIDESTEPAIARIAGELARELDSTLSSASVHLLLPDLLILTIWQAT